MTRRSTIGLLIAAGVAGVFSAAGVTATLGNVPGMRFHPSKVEEGRIFFAQVCQACHTGEPDKNKNGPSLFGVVGRQAGSVPGFDYSDAMREVALTWNDETLDGYLADPKNFVPGNKMPYSLLWGATNEDRRKGVIAYLHTLQ